MKATLYSNTTPLGTLDLHIMDASMGVVGGLLSPTAAYLALQPVFRKANSVFTKELKELTLNVQLENGYFLHGVGLSFGDFLEFPEEIQVDIPGLHYHVIEDYFEAPPALPFLDAPWHPVDITSKLGIEAEILKEIGVDGSHRLSKYAINVIGTDQASDDVLCYMTTYNECYFGIVHPTFKGKQEPDDRWPRVTLYDDFMSLSSKG